jgi:signal transduction histidine kinase
VIDRPGDDSAHVVTDGGGIILEANAAAAAALNVHRPFLVGKPLVVFVSPTEIHAFFTRLAGVRTSGRSQSCEFRLWPYRRLPYDAAMQIGYTPRGGGGGRFTWQWLAPTRRPAIAARPAPTPAPAVDDERGERGERPVDPTDERGERPVDPNADALETLRRVYVAAVSHELLTPLTIIKGHAELLADPAIRHDAALAEPALRAIEEELDRLRRQVGNVLDSTRVSAGQLTIQRGPLALRPLVEETLRRFGGRSRLHQFVAALPERLPLVRGDQDRLESVLYNLLDNAVKYAPHGGRVLVRAVVRPAEVEISVEDEGPGIPPAERQHVFQPYYRVAAGSTSKGSGLGLYICEAIVAAHRGRVWVQSSERGGAVVHFTVPRADAKPAAGTGEP